MRQIKTEDVQWNGTTWRRYPDAPDDASRKYFVAIKGGHRRYGRKRLHQAIWEHEHGTIPAGNHVHHKDHNPLNNDPANLECLPGADHLKRHGDELRGKPASQRQKLHLDRVRPMARGWHQSEEGRDWHREHAKTSLRVLRLRRKCAWCGVSYEAKAIGGKFCNPKCRSAWRRADGRDDVVRACGHCGASFTINKNQPTKLCSMRCVALAREAVRRVTRA